MKIRKLLVSILLLVCFLLPACIPAVKPTSPTVIDDEWSRSKKTVELSTGINMRYVESGPKNGEPLILLHGMNDSSRSWSLMLPYLGNKYHIYIPDLRGHGDTDKPTFGYAPEDMAGDIIAFMDALKIEKASVVGHSMGSFIAQYLVIDHPDRINKVALIGTFAQGSSDASTSNPEVTEWFWTTISTLPEPIDPNSEFMMWWYATINPVDEAFMSKMRIEAAAQPLYVWKAVAKGLIIDDHRYFFKYYNAPTLILWGSKDDFAPQSDQDAIKKYLPKATWIEIPDVGHSTQWEVPEKTANYILKFLAG
jgi:non-heme chloroperoxidase